MKKKRIYMKPDVKVRQIQMPRILAGSQSEAKTEDLEEQDYEW